MDNAMTNLEKTALEKGLRESAIAPFAAASWTTRFSGILQKYRRDDAGFVLVFGLYTFILMLVISGMAIDYMRYETVRTRLQQTLDRSILAAAAIAQPLDPKDVVLDYFAKEGVLQFINPDDIKPVTGMTYRTVTATARASVKTMFLNLVGHQYMGAIAVGQAEEKVNQVEISMVLDVSNSMNDHGRLGHLKEAAIEFIEEVLDPSNPDTVSISIIPFNTQVVAGRALLSHYPNVSTEHTSSYCVDFTAAQFQSRSLAPNTALNRTDQLDPFYRNRWVSGSNPNSPLQLPVCQKDANREIVAFSQDKTKLVQRINALTASGNTSIDVGAKWGVTLLDPATQPIISALANDTDNDPPVGIRPDTDFSDRPLPYDNTEVLKILIVMTDGHNTNQYYVNPTYYGTYVDGFGNVLPKLSNVWKDPSSGRYSWFNSSKSGSSKYWVPNGIETTSGNWRSTPQGGVSAVRLSYVQLWSEMSPYYDAYYHRYASSGRSNDYYDWRDAVLRSYDKDEKNDRLTDICTAAKFGKNIAVFTIAFEIDDVDAAVMKDCASTDSHYWKVDGKDISTAFAGIAKTISKLRLTQ